ncbi:hypothetical protein [Priestia megaterium]|uniref:hypothetical protein n=1 Tax=Priestia megaterium TaxID=1404 RepID=UPI000BFBB209|nr:hypothetical protein [Priestia megaterium]PGR04078.1 hypothetical protein COA23_20205 [Priestia megaterium]
MTFRPDPLLQDAINNNRIRHIRSAISSYMVSDPTDFRDEIKSAIDYVEKNGKVEDLWQDHDGRSFKDSLEWNEEYFGLLQAQLMNNFSKKRFNHALKVGKEVYGKDQAEQIIMSGKPANKVNFSKIPDNRNGSDMGKFLPVLIGMGVAAVTLIIYLVNKK